MMSAHSHRTRPIANERYVLPWGARIFCRNAIAAAKKTALHAVIMVINSEKVVLLSVSAAKKMTELPAETQTSNPSNNTRGPKLSSIMTTTIRLFRRNDDIRCL